MGEPVFFKSMQRRPFTDTIPSKTVSDSSYFIGPVSLHGIVAAKGALGVGRYSSGRNGMSASFNIEPTPYQALSLQGKTEPGFSGSPIYNEWGEVVGIVSGGYDDVVLAGSARDFPALIAMFK